MRGKNITEENVLLCNWYLFGVTNISSHRRRKISSHKKKKNNLSYTHKTRSWYLLGVLFKFQTSTPVLFIFESPLPLPPTLGFLILKFLVVLYQYWWLLIRFHKCRKNIEVKPWSQDLLIAAGAYPSFCSMKRLEVFLLPLDRMLVHRRSLPHNLLGFPQQFTSTHLYTWVERGTVRVKCLAQEHNTMSPARARTRTARSGVKRTNQEDTTPPKNIEWCSLKDFH